MNNLASDFHLLGIFLNYRSIKLDTWTKAQIIFLKSGGNSKLKAYFEKYNIQDNSPIEFKFKTKASQHYRQMLYGLVNK
jgi:hypothetical protein